MQICKSMTVSFGALGAFFPHDLQTNKERLEQWVGSESKTELRIRLLLHRHESLICKAVRHCFRLYEYMMVDGS